MTPVIDEPRDAFRAAVLADLGPGFFRGFIASYYRTFAVPQIAAELVRHGGTLGLPAKRATDTAIAIYEIIGDPGGARASAMLAYLKHAHREVRGDAEDFEYVLYSLLVVPARFLERYGHRQLTEHELAGGVAVLAEIGEAMGVANLRASYAEWVAFQSAYEGAYVQRTHDSDALLRASLPILASRMPPGFSWAASRLLSALVMDRLFQGSLGLPSPGLGRMILRQTLRTDVRRTKGRPFFEPGKSGSGVYPQGYKITDIGTSRS